MNDHDFDTPCTRIRKFGFGDKLFIRLTFYLSVAVGVYGMWPAGAMSALGYAAYVAVSYSLLMRYSVCARCPHVFVAGDCLFVPAPLVKLVVAPREGRLKVWEAAIAAAAALGTIAIPVYWLAGDPVLLIAFLALTLGYLVGLAGHVCKKCQVEVCPLNRNPGLR